MLPYLTVSGRSFFILVKSDTELTARPFMWVTMSPGLTPNLLVA